MSESESAVAELADWDRLFKAQARFMHLVPWRVLPDPAVLDVHDPETPEVFHCFVMGGAGIEFGLLAHRQAGLNSFLLADHDINGIDETLVSQDCINFSMCDRDLADADDRAVYASLGLKFRGRGAWPVFRSCKPPYLAAHLSRIETRQLATCLEQAYELALDIAAGLALSDDDLMHSRALNAAGIWETREVPYPTPTPSNLDVDIDQVEKALATLPRAQSTWEIALLALQRVRGEEGQPDFYARLLLCVDEDTGFMFSPDLLGPESTLQNSFLSTLVRAEFIPAQVTLISEYLCDQLYPLTEELGIEMNITNQLLMAEEAGLELKMAFGIDR